IFLLAGLIVIGALVDLATPLVYKWLVDEVMLGVGGSGGSLEKIAWLVGLTFALGVIGSILTAVSERMGDHFSGRLRKYLTERFYLKVLTLPQSYFDGEMSGKIVNQLNRGITSIYGFVNTSTNFIIPTILQSVFTIVVLAYYNIWIALLTFGLFPVYLSISYYSTKKWGKEEVKKNKIEDLLRGRITEVIGNIKVVKSFNTQKSEYNFVTGKLDSSNEIYAKQSSTFHVLDFWRNFSLTVILSLINILVFYNAFTGVLTIGETILILQLIIQARRPLFAMSFILTQVQQAESGSKEFFEVLDLISSEEIDSTRQSDVLEHPSIEFNDVSFEYESYVKVLEGVNFKINENETVALVGHSGAGKTTIINLIMNFYKASGGDILLSGKTYKDIDTHFLRNNIALVFQDNELFSSTIRDNVSYGRIDATDESVENALKLANAFDFVQKLPNGIHSEIGERGVKLSGGQKQRIQIARAIMKDSPILILDEATSSLDAQSEKEVQSGLENLTKNKLVIIIAHRFSTIQNVSKIIVLDGGSIVEYGSPAELARKPGVYSDLLRYQIEGNKKLLEKYEIY
ncbi:MAG: ABC transporter ATP-binding protein/permease, partial [bacterium]|nr:ABC transporter ATP-binding protein/permease [bacterium]